MRSEIEVLAGAPAEDLADRAPFLAPRWAAGLATVLLLGLAVATAARRWEASGGGPEIVIQQPVPAEPFPAGARADTTAPDPGDEPPP